MLFLYLIRLDKYSKNMLTASSLECHRYDTNLHLIVRLQLWTSGEWESPFHCHYWQVHCDPERWWDLTNFPPSKDLTRHFIVKSYVRIKTHAWLFQKYLVCSALPILGRIKRQAMKSASQSRYFLEGRPLRTRQTTYYHPPEVDLSLGMSFFFNPERYYILGSYQRVWIDLLENYLY